MPVPAVQRGLSLDRGSSSSWGHGLMLSVSLCVRLAGQFALELVEEAPSFWERREGGGCGEAGC